MLDDLLNLLASISRDLRVEPQPAQRLRESLTKYIKGFES